MLKQLVLFASIWIISLNTSIAIANSNKVATAKLYLEYIKLDQSTDMAIQQKNINKKHHSRLYIQITEYSNIKHPKEYRIPMYPKHWLSADLLKINNILLWQDIIEPLENKKLIISLIDNDQSLGSVKLMLNNQNYKKLQMNWNPAGFSKEQVKIKHKQISNKKLPNNIIFSMHSNQGAYLVKFYITK